ncbi:MAG: hypothetical protein DWQ19_11685 [Crenarchaeota archaeon]|mgnify:CR=1 FL=1|nr:MAG: hypothetical protein DWQ19_11685 [Thermoproteota archaeon]
MKKRTTEEVRKYFAKQGCELLSEYTGAKNKLTYKCTCGNISTTIWSNFIKGHRCGLCKKSGPKKKRSVEEVKQIFKERGCEFLDKEFVNSNYKHNYKCKCGYLGKITFAGFFRQNQNCFNCGIEKNNKKNKEKNKEMQNKVKKYFEKHNCQLLDVYVKYNIKMNYICSCGRQSKIDWDHFKRGQRCGFCSSKGRVKKYTIEEVHKIFKERGCEFLDKEYKNSDYKHNYKCKCGNLAKISLHAFVHQNQYCYKCGIEKQKGPNAYNWITDREEEKDRRLFRKKCYKILEHTYNMVGSKKKDRTHKILGYSPQDLRNHIEKHPNYKDLKNQTWHLDHIFPIYAFLEYGITDPKLINSLDNLQPLSGSENSSKCNKYKKRDFEKWLANKGVNLKECK